MARSGVYLISVFYLYLTNFIRKEEKYLLIPNQKVAIRWHPKNKEYYTSLGYEFTHMKDEFMVSVEDLPKQSHAVIKLQCDYCGQEFSYKYQNYINRDSSIDKIACKCCKHKKIQESVQEKYGVNNVFQLEEVKDKIKETNFVKYGTAYYSQTQEYADKIVKTCMSKYGETNYFKTQNCKEKIRLTNMQKFGYPYACQNQKVVDKIKKSLNDKYGGIGMGSRQTCVKIRRSMSKNGTVPSSKPERQLCDILIQIYGEQNCKPSFPCERYVLDCLVELNECRIDVEFDGKYWHQNIDAENKRNSYLLSQGYKILRLKSGNAHPIFDIEAIIKQIELLVKGVQDVITIDLDIR